MIEILYTGDLTDFKNQYCKAVEKIPDRNFTVKIHYTGATNLHYKNRTKYDQSKQVHEMKSLFFYGDENTCNTMGDNEMTAKQAFYSPIGRNKSGFYLPLSGLEKIEIIEAIPKDYSEAWLKIAKSMRKNNINLKVADNIEDCLFGKTDKMSWSQNWYTPKDKPKIINFADLTRGQSIEQLKTEARPLDGSGTHWNKHLQRRKNGLIRDRSIELYETKEGEGWKFHAASEFTGCGNGQYYTMFSNTQAVWAEND